MAGLVVAGLTTWQYEGTTAKKKHEHRISYLTGGGLLMEGLEAHSTNRRGARRNGQAVILSFLGGSANDDHNRAVALFGGDIADGHA